MKVIEDIRKAESEADEIVESAKKRAQEVVSSARSNSARIISIREKEAHLSAEKILAQGREKVSVLREKLLEDGRLRAAEVFKAGQRRKEKAVAHVLESFEEFVK